MRSTWLIGLACATACGRVRFDEVSTTTDAPIDGASAAWRLIQVAGAGQGASPANAVTLAPTTANSLIVVAAEIQNIASMVSAITDDAGNTYQPVPGGTAIDTLGVALRLELWYAPAAAAGATTITSTSTPQPTVSIVAWEFTDLASAPFDRATSISDGAVTTRADGPAITIESGELAITAVLVQFMAVSLVPGTGFTNDSFVHDNAFAHVTDPHAPAGSYQASWDTDQPSSYCGVSATFRPAP